MASFRDTYHGRSFLTMTLTGDAVWKVGVTISRVSHMHQAFTVFDVNSEQLIQIMRLNVHKISKNFIKKETTSGKIAALYSRTNCSK